MAKKILILSTDFGTERDEITVPLHKLREAGHDVVVATPSGEDVQTFLHDKDRDVVVPTDKKVADVTGEAAADFDVIVLPGGTLTADAARVDEGVRGLVTGQAEAGRTIAAICHAPWVLVEAGLAKDKNMTSVGNIRTDVVNAGASWHDEPVVECDTGGWKLITSRTPDDINAFVEAIDKI